MNDQFFIRIRGKVQGPFDTERLRQLARRGQFSRLHEVSTDSQRWQPAKDFPGLFAAPAQAETATATYEPAPAPVAVQSSAPAARMEEWFYAQGGGPAGPIAFHQLVGMLQSGQIPPETSVWREGMADWVPANSVGQLASAFHAEPQRHRHGTEEKQQIGLAIVQVLAESRGWIIFIAVMVFINAGSILVNGIYQFTVGVRVENPARTIAGITQIILSFAVGFQGYLLISYTNAISRFILSRSEGSLRSALAAIKSYWVYCGVLLIVGLSITAIAIILFVVLVGSLPIPSEWI